MASEQKLTYERALEILGLENGATEDEIKRAYKNLARLCHPDKSKDSEATRKFQELSSAYRVLISDENGSEFDESLFDFDGDYSPFDDSFMYFNVLQEFVFRVRFASRVVLSEDGSFGGMGYSRKYTNKSFYFQEEKEDTELYNNLRKKQPYGGDNHDLDDLDPDKVVKKYKTIEEWEKAKKSKKRSKSATPRQLSKKQQIHQQFRRDKQMKEIHEQLLKDNEKTKAKLDKLSKKREQEVMSRGPPFIPTDMCPALDLKKTKLISNTGLKKSSSTNAIPFNRAGEMKTVSTSTLTKLPNVPAIIIKTTTEKKQRKDVKHKETKPVFEKPKTMDAQRQLIASQLESTKAAFSLEDQVTETDTRPRYQLAITSQTLNYAAAAKKPISPTGAIGDAGSGWEYSPSDACAAIDNHLVPASLDEEEQMIQRAIAISIEDEKKQQQRLMDFYKQKKADQADVSESGYEDNQKPVLIDFAAPLPYSEFDNKPFREWEKFGVRPKVDFYKRIKVPPPPLEFDSTEILPTTSNKSYDRGESNDIQDMDKAIINRGATQISDNNSKDANFYFRNITRVPEKSFLNRNKRKNVGQMKILEDLDKIDENVENIKLKPIGFKLNDISDDALYTQEGVENKITDIHDKTSNDTIPDVKIEISNTELTPGKKTPPGLTLQAETGQPEMDLSTFPSVHPMQMPFMSQPPMFSSLNPIMNPLINPSLMMSYMGMLYPVVPPVFSPAFVNPLIPNLHPLIPPNVENQMKTQNFTGVENVTSVARLEGGEDEIKAKKMEKVEDEMKFMDEEDEGENERVNEGNIIPEFRTVSPHNGGKRRGCLRIPSLNLRDKIKEKSDDFYE